MRLTALAFMAIAGTTAMSSAAVTFSFTITADNHYAIYNPTGVGTNVSFVGENEQTFEGNPGTYNWSLPEQWTAVSPTGEMYIAGWSDDFLFQGVLAQVFADGSPIHSGDARWEVTPTNLDLDDLDTSPSVGQMASLINTANTNMTWEATFTGGNNGVAPWGFIPGITQAAKWVWWQRPGSSDPLTGDTNAGEFLIFRLTIPTPASLALVGLGGLVATRRRRA
jgi:hypothetical protein